MKVLITGTSSGIGLGAAKLFCDMGHEVIGIDINPASFENPNYKHFVADVTKPETLPFLDVDAIINNAGVVDEENSIAVNLQGYINIGDKYYREGKTKSVVNVGSIAAKCGLDTQAYAASQGGRISLTRIWAQNWSRTGTRVNSFSPGAVMTSLEPELYKNSKLVQDIANESLLGKWCSVSTCAKWLYFLTCVDDSLTGQDILLDNGESLKRNFIHV